MTKIVLVGAGSVEFTRNLLGDILSFDALRDAELVLHDIDADRLATADRMARWTAEALGATPTIEGILDRRRALEGADYVIDTIQVGGARATQIDFEIPGRYGLQYTINDTINVGGVMRGLRTIPVVLGIAADMADVCPDALFLNYTNPMGMLVRAVDEAVGFPTVGLCHSVYWTVHRLAEYVGVPFEEVDALSGGVNHLAWILRLEHRGRDLYPDLQDFVDAGRVPDDDLVRADLYKRFGWYPTNRLSTTPSTTRGSSPRARSSRSTCRSGSTSRASPATSTSSPRPSACSTPARRSRSSAAASTRR